MDHLVVNEVNFPVWSKWHWLKLLIPYYPPVISGILQGLLLLCSQKNLSARMSFYLQPITNCSDFLLGLQFPLLMSLFSKVSKRASWVAHCWFSSWDSQYYWRSKSPSSGSHNSVFGFWFLDLIFLMFIYFWERERETECEQQKGRERERENLKQNPGSELSAQSPMQGSNPQTVGSWPEPKLVSYLTKWAIQGPPQ